MSGPEPTFFYPVQIKADTQVWQCLRCAALVVEWDDHDEWHMRILPELIAAGVLAGGRS